MKKDKCTVCGGEGHHKLTCGKRESPRPMYHLDLEPTKYVLVREGDGKEIKSNKVCFVEFNQDSRAQAIHNTPAKQMSCLMGDVSVFYTWQTTIITEIVEQRKGYLKFKTKNSTYELFGELLG